MTNDFNKDKVKYIKAKNLLEAENKFKENTGFGSQKAGEILVSCFVNAWLEVEKDPRWLEPQKPNEGADSLLCNGCQLLEVPNWVEIKTRKLVGETTANIWFEFAHKFLPKDFTHGNPPETAKVLNAHESMFKKHCMVVFACLKDASVHTLYIAYGPLVMNELTLLLEKDTKRPGFSTSGTKDGKSRKIDNPRINHAGLDALIKLNKLNMEYKFVQTTNDNWIKKIENSKSDPTFENIENLLNG